MNPFQRLGLVAMTCASGTWIRCNSAGYPMDYVSARSLDKWGAVFIPGGTLIEPDPRF